MGGICGEWNLQGVDDKTLEWMNGSLIHRGPDGQGAVLLGEAGLAMRRLAAADLAAGPQPLSNEDGSVWIVCDGEIYNHRELRRELAARGHGFKPGGDVEVILHLYEERGERVVDELRGKFAFALWDGRRRKLLLARDRFGQKPLFYRFAGRRLLFGSEIKAILAAGGPGAQRPEIDLQALDEYLTLSFVPGPRTLFQGIRKLPAAHLLVLDASGLEPRGGFLAPVPRIEVRRYWQLRYHPKRGDREAELVEEARERIREAVESQGSADVPVGAYLSGGLDSSLVAAMMTGRLAGASEARGEPLQTFAVGVGDPRRGELAHARAVARYCGTRHHEEMVWPDRVQLLPSMVWHLDEPADPEAACMYQAASLASRHVKVVLTGDGADELFAGYDRYSGCRWANLYAALPAGLRRHLLGPALHTLRASPTFRSLTRKAPWLRGLSFHPLHEGGRRYAHALAGSRFGPEGRGGLYAPDVVAALADGDPLGSVIHAFDEAEARYDLDRMLQADVSTRLPEHSLMLADRMSMAHGLEARSPFLDHPLAEFAASLPTHLKIRGRNLKYILRRAAAPYLPEAILKRPRQGFSFPLGDWMKGPLLPVLRHLLARPVLVEEGIFRREPIERLVEEYVAGRAEHHLRLWMILNVEVWFRIYLRGEPLEDLTGLLRERLVGSAA